MQNYRHTSGLGMLAVLWIVGFLLALFATYGVAWGYEAVSSASCAFSQTPTTIYSPPSSSSGWTVVNIDPLGSHITSISCGPDSTLYAITGPQEYSGSVHCTGYSLKVRSAQASGGCVQWLIGTPSPPELGAISVDTSGVESSIDEYSESWRWGFLTLLFFVVFLPVIFYFRR